MATSSNITMRIEASVLNRIDQAARMSGKNRTQFMVDEALRKADALLPDPDQLHYALKHADFEQILTLLEQKPDAQKLARLLDHKGLPWDRT